MVPAYCRTRQGRVYRLLRASELTAPDRIQFALRAVPVKQDGDPGRVLTREIETAMIRDMLAIRQAIPTPEDTYEALWQQLRVDLDVLYEGR
ncbi:MAG: hypothetical protein NVSMB2_25320 [Chloroflexota bacterium]